MSREAVCRPTREEIDARAVVEAEKRRCSCGGARNCGCWNLAMRLLLEARADLDLDRLNEEDHDALKDESGFGHFDMHGEYDHD